MQDARVPTVAAKLEFIGGEGAEDRLTLDGLGIISSNPRVLLKIKFSASYMVAIINHLFAAISRSTNLILIISGERRGRVSIVEKRSHVLQVFEPSL